MGSGCGKNENAVIPSTLKHELYKPVNPVQKHKRALPGRKRPPMSRENSAMQRFNTIAINTTNPLKLIDGYLNKPLVSLEEALKPFDGKIEQLSHYIKEAKAKCHYPSKHKLTHDESAAIYIYTMKWGSQSLYDCFQKAWDSENRSQLKSWFSYLKLFKSAFDKLPNTKREVWQGTPFDNSVKDKLISKSTSMYSCMGSCSPSASEIRTYLQQHSGAQIILIGYESMGGKVVTEYTASKSKEVMMMPGVKLGLTKYAVIDDNGSVVVHISGEIDPPETIKVTTPKPREKHFVCRTNNHDNSFIFEYLTVL